MNSKRKMVVLLLISGIYLNGCEEKGDSLLPLDTIPAYEETLQEERIPQETAEQSDPVGESRIVSEDAPETCYVYVCGAVMNPGVYELPEGSRIFKCIEAAGGFTEEAGREGINLAMPVSDGSMIWIPTVSELAEQAPQTLWPESYAAGTDASFTEVEELININTASAELLSTLPGIGVAKADGIIAYRERFGAFISIEDIMNVEGIKEGLFAKISSKITV